MSPAFALCAYCDKTDTFLLHLYNYARFQTLNCNLKTVDILLNVCYILSVKP
jgi:hypothetical protein